MYIKDGNYIEHENDIFEDMYYIKEEERGFYPKEDLLVPGRYEVELGKKENKTITFIASLEENIEEIDGENIIKAEINRLEKIVNNSNLISEETKNKEFIKDLIIATDNFVIRRKMFGTHSILAGLPWFLDWGRDAMIAFEGTLLKT